MKSILAEPVGAPIKLSREEAEAIARDAFGSRPDLPSGIEYVRGLKTIWAGLLKSRGDG